VNQVGVDVNTASSALLQYVAGIGKRLAENIIQFREDNGKFHNRKSLLNVPGLGAKSFEQCAGFMRMSDSDDPLDASSIHPESYAIAASVLQRAQVSMQDDEESREAAFFRLLDQIPLEKLADELGTGALTLADIMEQLVQPGRDPRNDVDPPMLRSDVLSMDDLHQGLILSGTVRNVVDFGAFVDIGVKQDGLLHSSKIPRDTTLGVGDIIRVSILNVDRDRGRIGLGWA